MIKTVLGTLALSLASLSAFAQMSPVGLWKTIDDDSKKEKSLVRIKETNGVYSGTIEKLLDPDSKQDAVCDKCTDDRKDKPKLGMEIIRGAKKPESGAVWEGGKILDPENGKEYTLRMTPLDEGKKLQVRGYIGPFYRTQIWTRVE